MESKIYTFEYTNGDIQKVQMVQFESWDQLLFLKPKYDSKSFDKLCSLYIDFIMPKYAEVFGTIVLFRIPDDIKVPFHYEDTEYGNIYEPITLANIQFKRHIHLVKGKLVFDNMEVRDFYHLLEEKGCLKVAKGKRNKLDFMPVGNHFGFLSENEINAKLKFNSSFFVMDKLDLGSIYDQVSVPIGLMVKDGVIYNPPQFDREVLLVNKQDEVVITHVSFKKLAVEIDGECYWDNEDSLFITRPEYKISPEGGFDVIVVNNEIVATKLGGHSEVPSGGFIIHFDLPFTIHNRHISYHGLDHVKFAIQVGNSVMIEGKKTEKFISPFYHFLKPWTVSYPPSMYPLNYKKDRAPRMVLGENEERKPVVLWFEGAGKFGYEAGKDSCGASLAEVADICEKLDIINAVHLDGGGSAEILTNNQRFLKVSDRHPDDFSEAERAIPVGLMIQ